MPSEPQPALSERESVVYVGCLYCATAAEQVPEVGPGEDWFYVPETGWACPTHAAAGARSALEVADERYMALRARCIAAEVARDVNADHLPKLRDALRRIVYIHDGALLGDVGDKLAREARRVLEVVGARV